ncbi:MAG: helix-turn-helix domain-containing protein [Pseudomonadota bacterium]
MPQSQSGETAIGRQVQAVLTDYFAQLAGAAPDQLYQQVMTQVEQTLLACTLSYTDGHQSQAADILGISRTTLRKKICRYQLDLTTPKETITCN